MSVKAPALSPNELLRRHMIEAVEKASLSNPEPDLPSSGSARKRARFDARAGSRLATVALVQDGEVLRWVYDPPPMSSRRRARRASAGAADDDVVHGFQFLEVPPNKVVAELEKLDDSLTPVAGRGVRVWTGGRPGQPGVLPKEVRKGRVLLLVHGTFSRGDMYFEELTATRAGRSFLKACTGRYDAIVTFDHPTLAMSPWLNALDLWRATADWSGPIDVVCHSRGGLAVAWWLRVARPGVKRVVFVGSPLEGTSLAAPAKLKTALDLLGNLARAIGVAGNAGATAVPMLAVAGGLMKIIGGALSFSANSPLIDAGVALVPGLASQSRVANNFELARLLDDDWATRYELYAVASNYEPATLTDPWWQFWKHFRTLPGRALDWGADAIFDGDNDLVVDTASMARLGHASIVADRCLTFGRDRAVHHCGYFREPKTLDFIQTAFKL